jgi:hypothetical protein
MQAMTSSARPGRPGPEATAGGPGVAGMRVVLAEDDVLLREGLASLLARSGFEVAGRAGDGPQLVALARQARAERSFGTPSPSCLPITTSVHIGGYARMLSQRLLTERLTLRGATRGQPSGYSPGWAAGLARAYARSAALRLGEGHWPAGSGR